MAARRRSERGARGPRAPSEPGEPPSPQAPDPHELREEPPVSTRAPRSRRSDLQERLEFLQLDPKAVEGLRRLQPLLEERADELVDAFYRHLLSFSATRRHLRDPAVRERLLGKQREYLLSLAGPRLDEAYVEERRRIGEVHERIGLEPRWYLGAYALYLSLLTPMVSEACGDDSAAAGELMVTLERLLTLDAQLAIESYIERSEDALESLNDELARTGRLLESRFAEQRRTLSQTEQRARAAEELASIGTLVAGLAHEIGTPMGVIQGHAKLLESAVEGERAQWRLKTIQEQIGRISRIIQSLLNMARPHASERLPVDLESLLENTLSFLTEKFQRRQVRVVRDLQARASVRGDPERLQQLCLNLFLNAVDAMPEGGELRVGLRSEPSRALIRVADTGTGIPAERLPHIFDPFVTSKEAGKGSGLGLTVVSGIVADHGGTIDVDSTPGEGTRFEIALPLAPEA